MSHCRFTFVSPSYFHTLGISMLSMCIGACHACTASLCDLRDPGWGNPGFRHCDYFCLAPVGSSGDFDVFVLLLLRWMTCSGRGTQAAWSLRSICSVFMLSFHGLVAFFFGMFCFAGFAVLVLVGVFSCFFGCCFPIYVE